MKLQSVDRTILVQSSNIDLGSVLPNYARTSILQMAGKYFGRLNTATVYFNREGPMYRCTVNVQMGALRMMSGEAENTDIYTAFKLALEKVAKQLRRAKRELRENKARRIDKQLALHGSLQPRRRLERAAPSRPVKIDHASAFGMAAE